MSYWRGTAVLKLSLLTLEQKKARRHVGRGTAVPGEVALFYSVFSAYWQRCTCLVSGVCSELLGTTESSCAIVRSGVQLAAASARRQPRRAWRQRSTWNLFAPRAAQKFRATISVDQYVPRTLRRCWSRTPRSRQMLHSGPPQCERRPVSALRQLMAKKRTSAGMPRDVRFQGQSRRSNSATSTSASDP